MNAQQIIILAILATSVALFLHGRWRHDMVAAAALLACVVAGLVPADAAFSGFSHPAVITVACVLILSSALQKTGLVDLLAQRLLPANAGPTVTIAALTGLGALLSSFMNNVGALALLMPVALQIAQRQQLPPGKVLMPLAFATILGGMTTLIGTPSNLIVSSFRAQAGKSGFAMFDFSPVGVTTAVIGVLFLALVGWRLVPSRERADVDSFETGAYLTEARVAEGSKAVGMSLREAEKAWEDAEAQIVGLIRNEVRLNAPHPARRLHAGDVLLIEADPEALASAFDTLGLIFNESHKAQSKNESAAKPDEGPETGAAPDSDADGLADKDAKPKETEERANGADTELVELVILPDSSLQGRNASDLQLRARYSINLLAISRQGSRDRGRLRSMRFRIGDVLLLQGSPDLIAEFASVAGCAPLATRALRAPDRQKMILAGVIMALAVGLAAFGVFPAAISFTLGVLLIMALRVLPLRSVYDAVDWPVIVLLGALIPVAQAMESTGVAGLIAGFLLDTVSQGNAIIALAVIMLATMTLSDVMNNAATAAVMCPIAIGAANQLGVSADPFLMAVAISASCAFLTPIGHQNNTLILGPGGFRFGDYWQLGLPLEILVAAVSIPLMLVFWPM